MYLWLVYERIEDQLIYLGTLMGSATEGVSTVARCRWGDHRDLKIVSCEE